MGRRGELRGTRGGRRALADPRAYPRLQRPRRRRLDDARPRARAPARPPRRFLRVRPGLDLQRLRRLVGRGGAPLGALARSRSWCRGGRPPDARLAARRLPHRSARGGPDPCCGHGLEDHRLRDDRLSRRAPRRSALAPRSGGARRRRRARALSLGDVAAAPSHGGVRGDHEPHRELPGVRRRPDHDGWWPGARDDALRLRGLRADLHEPQRREGERARRRLLPSPLGACCPPAPRRALAATPDARGRVGCP